MSISIFARFRIMEALVQPSNELLEQLKALSEGSGYAFDISSAPVPGTQLFVVHTSAHHFRPEYTVTSGTFGFRVPFNFPDAAPEDAFFIAPTTVKLTSPDPVRNSVEINRAGVAPGLVLGSALSGEPVLLFSWHLWNTVPWNRRVHKLLDHYTHCVRRFSQPEHD